MNYEKMIKSLTLGELFSLEEILIEEIDMLEGEVASLQGQIDEIWDEYSWYDEQTGDHNLTGNAYYFEDNLQGDLSYNEEKKDLAEKQLEEVHKRIEELSNDE